MIGARKEKAAMRQIVVAILAVLTLFGIARAGAGDAAFGSFSAQGLAQRAPPESTELVTGFWTGFLSWSSAAGTREAARVKFTNNKAKTSRFPLMMLLRELTRQLYVVLTFLGTPEVRSKHQ
jgi:hypothetical protein